MQKWCSNNALNIVPEIRTPHFSLECVGLSCLRIAGVMDATKILSSYGPDDFRDIEYRRMTGTDRK